MTLTDQLAAVAWHLRDPDGFEQWFNAQPEDVRTELCDFSQQVVDAGLRIVDVQQVLDAGLRFA